MSKHAQEAFTTQTSGPVDARPPHTHTHTYKQGPALCLTPQEKGAWQCHPLRPPRRCAALTSLSSWRRAENVCFGRVETIMSPRVSCSCSIDRTNNDKTTKHQVSHPTVVGQGRDQLFLTMSGRGRHMGLHGTEVWV